MGADKKKSPLSKDELKKFREALEKRRAEILGDVKKLEDEALRSSGDEVSVDHMADHGSESFEKDQTIGFIEREGQSLKMIQQALERIDDGSYGICEQCEGRIKKTRLRALPYARLCLDCQMAEEGG